MKVEARHNQILEILSENASVGVTAISASLGVSQVTIRNDLKVLSTKGLIHRNHGGASPALHPSILDRQRHRPEIKSAIAKAAADMVQDGDTIMIDAGTTTALIVKHLLGKRDVRLVTSNLLALTYARMIPTLNLTLVGGEYRAETESLVGPMTLRALEEYHVKLAFIGTDGFSLENGTTTHLVEGAEVVKTLRKQSDKTVLLTDSSKYGKTGFAKILPLESVDHIICDGSLPEEVALKLKKNHLELTLV
jgi:DeoR family transcriptional regulator, galactitol utilization operon repressor